MVFFQFLSFALPAEVDEIFLVLRGRDTKRGRERGGEREGERKRKMQKQKCAVLFLTF